MSKHTPVPWTTWQNEAEGLDRHVISAYESEGPFWQIGVVWAYEGSDEAAANAAFIIRACNAHEDLLEAAKIVLAATNATNNDDTGTIICCPGMEALHAAITKAEGGTP